MISVLIATRNRPSQIEKCLYSISKSDFTNYEIILIDQSDDDRTKTILPGGILNKIKYIKMEQRGKSRALNKALKIAKGDVFAFTDDDCIVDRHWLKEIKVFLKESPEVAGVFGNILPYQPGSNLGKICPATFTGKPSRHNDIGILHYRDLGSGGNMALRKQVFGKVVSFREWLGVGSLSSAGEETEVIFRLLLNKFTLATNTKMIVYHNRWLSSKEERVLQSKYTCGIMAFCTFYLFSDHKSYIQKLIKIRINERIGPVLRKLKNLARELGKECVFLILELFAVLKGFVIGLVMSISKYHGQDILRQGPNKNKLKRELNPKMHR